MRTNEAITTRSRSGDDRRHGATGEDKRARLCSRSAGHAVTQPPAKNNAGPGARKNVPIHRLAIIQSRGFSPELSARIYGTRKRNIYICTIMHIYVRYAAECRHADAINCVCRTYVGIYNVRCVVCVYLLCIRICRHVANIYIYKYTYMCA